MGPERFTWRDGERTIHFGDGVAARAAAILAEGGWEGFALLAGRRGIRSAPADLRAAASAEHVVEAGPVPDAAAALLAAGASGRLVAWGGGRVIDAAKAVVAARGDGAVCAVPTTLSGADMTRIHRLPPGVDAARRVRPALVLVDPRPLAGLDPAQRRASAANAFAHGAEALVTPLANPVASMAAVRGARLLADGLAGAGEGALALGSTLCAYAMDSAGIALHHVVCQSAVRVLGTPHAETNASVLPVSLAALGRRAPGPVGELAAALGASLDDLPEHVRGLFRPPGLGAIGADEALVGRVGEVAAGRSELLALPDPPDRDELEALVRAAW
jgi:alcohol dehydrogenase class IV